MALHLIKISVGAEDIADLANWQRERREHHGRLFHTTRMMPRRTEEILDGGSIYWIIKGLVRVRQQVTGIERGLRDDGTPTTLLVLDPLLVRTWPQPWRIFQGWRYLEPAAAPRDLEAATGAAGGDVAEMPPEMLAELRELGLI